MMVNGDVTDRQKEAVDELGLTRGITGEDATAYGRTHFIRDLQKPEVKKMVEKREKIVVVREPFQRLLSAYRNKIQPNRTDFFGDISKHISKTFRKDKKDKTVRSATFEEFLKYYVDKNEKMNEHWQTYNQLVLPCVYNYDYIFKLNDITNESNWLFQESLPND